MKKTLSTIDLHFLVQELQQLLGAFVDKIYQHGQKEFTLQLHLAGKGKQFIRITPALIWLSKEKPKAPEKIFAFCQLLRKHLEGTKLSAIEQPGGERIAQLAFERNGLKHSLIVELFGTGNTILLDENKKIIGAAEQHEWKDRTIKTGETYKPPPAKPNIFTISEKEFTKVLVQSKENASKTLATTLCLGGETAEQLCGLAGIDPKKQATESDAKKLFAELQKLLSQKPEPLSEKIEATLSAGLLRTAEEEIEKKYKARLQKLEKMIAAQKENLAMLEKEASENQRKGELIYENYQQLKQILEELKEARKKMSWQELKEKLKNKKIKLIDEKTGTFSVEL